ncbi:MAG: glycosyltransferase family 1 protein [Candidatus Magasanikbacteria bacterium]|jgi:glycosyltransferase involved in cell wall biosynthesis
MRIGIDARMLGPKQGGLGRYIEQLIANLEKIDSQNEYAIFLRKENWDDYNPTNLRFKKVLADIGWYGWAEQIYFPYIIKNEKVDLMHFPHWNVPLFYNQKFVVTIHDLLLLHFPTRHASTLGPIWYWIKNKMFRFTLNHAVKKANKIITISEFTKQDIVQTLKIDHKKIVTTYLSPLEKTMAEAPFSVYKKYEINKPYWLYVGVAYPHKNLFKLVDAWEIFCKQHGHTYHLVLTGKKNYFYHQLEKYIEQKNIKDIILTDFVPDNELPELYRNASLYVFPSLYEGFGLPPLEAMQYDLPVISSDRTCLPEILEEAAIYFNPDDPHSITSAANLVIKDNDTRKNLIEKGQKTLQKYSWVKTATQTLQIYNETK